MFLWTLLIKAYLVTECHITEFTLVGLYTQMYSYVSFEIALLNKLLWTMWTLVSWTNVNK